MTTICLDGTDKEALASYLSGIEEVINWSYEDGIKVDISDICGQCHEVFTTRAGGSMEVEFVYMGRSIRFLIQEEICTLEDGKQGIVFLSLTMTNMRTSLWTQSASDSKLV